MFIGELQHLGIHVVLFMVSNGILCNSLLNLVYSVCHGKGSISEPELGIQHRT